MKSTKTIFLVLIIMALDIYAKTEVKAIPFQDTPFQILDSRTGRQVPLNLLESKTSKDPSKTTLLRIKGSHKQHSRALSSRRDDLLWTLQHVDDNAEYWLGSGAADDTFAVVFTPAAPTVVSEVYMQWHTPGSFRAFAADYSEDARMVSPLGECSNIDTGSFSGSPIGTHRTPITANVIENAVSDWSSQVDIGGTFVVFDSSDLGSVPSFVIAIIKDGEHPLPLADYTADRGFLTYTWFGGPWRNGLWGNYSAQVDLMMLVKVAYPYGGHAPIVNRMSVVSNTYNTTGPFTVIADLYGEVIDGLGIHESDSIKFHWTVNNVETIGRMTPLDILPDGNGSYTYDITGLFQSGDVIEYWITAQRDLPSESLHISFEIKEPEHPLADLLLVADNASDEQVIAGLYRRAVDDLGVEYEFWDTSIEKGIDGSVINQGWSNIIVYGWGTDIVPVIEGESDPGFADFLNNGGSLVLADQDLFFSHGLAAELQFDAGDFAYDYLGLESATNDPVNIEEVSSADTSFYGVAGSLIDINFTNTPLVLKHSLYGTSSWADYLIPGNAATLFRGVHDSLTYGVEYETPLFSTAFFSFMPDAAIDESSNDEVTYGQFEVFMEGVINWLGIPTDIVETPYQPQDFTLVETYPNPFNPSTTIAYDLPERTEVSLVIYDIAGREVLTLISKTQTRGSYKVSWDGTNRRGHEVNSGVYLLVLKTTEQRSTKKLTLLK